MHCYHDQMMELSADDQNLYTKNSWKSGKLWQRLSVEVSNTNLDDHHAQALRQAAPDLQRLGGHGLLLVLLQGKHGAHVVQAIRQLDDQHQRLRNHVHDEGAQLLLLFFGESDAAALARLWGGKQAVRGEFRVSGSANFVILWFQGVTRRQVWMVLAHCNPPNPFLTVRAHAG